MQWIVTRMLKKECRVSSSSGDGLCLAACEYMGTSFFSCFACLFLILNSSACFGGEGYGFDSSLNYNI